MKKRLYICMFSIIAIFVVVFLSNEREKELQFIEEWQQTKFDLRDKIPYNYEYQIKATYKSCWAYAGLDSIETNLLLHKKVNYDFSEIYIEYITSNLFGGERELDSGNSVEAVFNKSGKYTGAVLESDIPNRRYDEAEYNLLLNAIPIVDKVDYELFAFNDTYFYEKIKKHITHNGSICATIYFDPLEKDAYNPKTHAYYYPNEEYNHVVSIIGWDDEYSKLNFPEGNRPENDGAYLVNCFWKNYGIIYISYEDMFINKFMIGVKNCELYSEY